MRIEWSHGRRRDPGRELFLKGKYRGRDTEYVSTLGPVLPSAESLEVYGCVVGDQGNDLLLLKPIGIGNFDLNFPFYW